MNIRKGFFRLTLVLSILTGTITLFSYQEWILTKKEIEVKLPDDWEKRSKQVKLNSIDKLLSNHDTFFLLPKIEQLNIRRQLKESIISGVETKIDPSKVVWDSPKKGAITKIPDWEAYQEADRRGILSPEKKALYEEAKRRGLVPGYLVELPDGRKFNLKFEKEPSKEELNRAIQELSRELGSYFLSLKLGWKELGYLAFGGFAPPWLIYLFIRWVILAFIVGGFRHKTRG